MQFYNKRKSIKDRVDKSDIEALLNNPAWQLLVQTWEEEANKLNLLLLASPLTECRDDKGRLIAASVDNIRGQLDNQLAILSSAKVLDEEIEADIVITKQFKHSNKPGGKDDE